MSEETALHEATITLNHPSRMSAFNNTMFRAIDLEPGAVPPEERGVRGLERPR